MLIHVLSVADCTLQYNIVEIATEWPTSLKYIFIFWPLQKMFASPWSKLAILANRKEERDS